MYRKILLTISVLLMALVVSHRAEAIVEHKELQVTVPVRFISVHGDFFERIGVDFDFPTVKEFFETNSGFGGGIGGGLLFPEALGNADVSVAAQVFGSRFSADEIRTQNGTMFPTDGSVTDVGLGIELALILRMTERLENSQTAILSRPALRLTAGGGVVQRDVDLKINGIPFVNDGGTALYGEIGAGIQFPLNGIGQPGQTALFVGVNHRVTDGLDLEAIPFVPFHLGRTSTTSARIELLIFITPRIIPVNEQEN